VIKEYLNILDEKDFQIFKEIESLRDKIILEDINIEVIDYETEPQMKIEPQHRWTKEHLNI
jgi:hypothetical protein